MQALICENGRVHFDMKCNCNKVSAPKDVLKIHFNSSVVPGEYRVFVDKIVGKDMFLSLIYDENVEKK